MIFWYPRAKSRKSAKGGINCMAKTQDEKEPKTEVLSNQGDLLKNRVNSIMNMIDDDEDEVDEELLEELKKPKKKFFGLF